MVNVFNSYSTKPVQNYLHILNTQPIQTSLLSFVPVSVFHDKHPLVLEFSLPQVYHQFDQYCRICKVKLSHSVLWLDCCRKCRFFVHFQCARSIREWRSGGNEIYDSDIVHLPAADESSANLLVEQFVKVMSTLNNNNSNFSETNHIKHWAHDEHHLQLITSDELNDHKDNDEIALLCDGCVKPIRTDGNLFYCCVPCKYFLHKVCAEFPEKIEHHLWPGETLLADKFSEPYNIFNSHGCLVPCSGIFFHHTNRRIQHHIGCVTLPKIIKHESHFHKLNQVYGSRYLDQGYGYKYRPPLCKSCGHYISEYKHGCEECDFYICERCIMKARTVKHPWDPHPLHLIYDAEMVIDHEHEFNCEFCSNDIYTIFWFYHCSACDLSFHLYECFERSCYRMYSNVKFGASDIIIDKFHHHNLKFVLNKKAGSCIKCSRKPLGEPVLQCVTNCKAILCGYCCLK